MFKINLKKTVLILTISIFSISSAIAAEECFEKTSRAIFKFNMAIDDVVLEPISKGYNKLPDPIKKGTSNFTSNIGHFYLFQIIYYKVTLTNLDILLEALL